MTTELERLLAWMDTNGYDSRALSTKMNYATDMVGSVLAGRFPCGRNFRWMFAKAFGDDVASTIFNEPIPANAPYGSAYVTDRDEAHKAVCLKANREKVPSAKLFRCHACGKPAQHNHPSYAPEDRPWVIPLCRSCHTKVHKGSLDLQLPLAPDLVRKPITAQRVNSSVAWYPG